jgi:hypothetical protein
MRSSTATTRVLKKLIRAERDYLLQIISNNQSYVSPDVRLVEVSQINDVSKRTANSLVKSGLVEFADPLSFDSDKTFIRLAGALEIPAPPQPSDEEADEADDAAEGEDEEEGDNDSDKTEAEKDNTETPWNEYDDIKREIDEDDLIKAPR